MAVDLSIIILALNEGAVLARNAPFLRHLLDEAEKAGFRPELIFEEDGSTDDTPTVIDEWARRDKRIRALHHRERLGKGGGLVRGVEHARGELLVMIDADVPLDLKSFLSTALTLRRGPDMVLPSRRHPESLVKGIPWSRRLLSRIFNWTVNGLLGLRISDTQCGIKAFRRSAWETIRPREFLGYDMDLELLVRARAAKLNVVEIPLNYTHTADQGFRVGRDGPRMLRSVWAARRLRRAA